MVLGEEEVPAYKKLTLYVSGEDSYGPRNRDNHCSSYS
jgi:hypothetical protein